MNYIIFERTLLEISSDNRFSITFRHLKNGTTRTFLNFINTLVERSKQFETYINVYRLYKDHGLVKVAWIVKGVLYTL